MNFFNSFKKKLPNNPLTGQHVEIICEPRKNYQQLKMNLKINFEKELHESVIP